MWLILEAKFGEETLAERLIGRISWSKDLVVKVLDDQSRCSRFKTTGWLQEQLRPPEVDQTST